MRLHEYYYRALGIEDFHMVLALKDPKNTEKYHGDDDMWEEAERLTREAMEESNIPYVEEIGGAAHYGPKVDFIVRSAIGREFAASTNQLDLYMPERFGLTFTNQRGEAEHPAVIHRAPLGSHERFVGFLIEHYAGAFPAWLAPVQVQVLPVAAEHHEYAASVRRAAVRRRLPRRAGRRRREARADACATASSRRSRTCSWSAATTWPRARSASTSAARSGPSATCRSTRSSARLRAEVDGKQL